ncbi:MAG: hypothetical protein PHH85_02200 [Candidatus Methanoperedens sp.]|nr:hypothetical protein [Candidatus Methanoperedens sp.]
MATAAASQITLESGAVKAQTNIASGATYPWTINYRMICPLGTEGKCDGSRTFRTKHGIAVYYCHDRQCLELWTGMLKGCPCQRAYECKGSRWEGKIEICNLREEDRTEVEELCK